MSFHIYDDPFEWFGAWFDHAMEHVQPEPNAVALATVDAQGNPSLRMVLLKQWDTSGFVFYTNYHSRKGQALLQTRKAAMTAHWRTLGRQIRIEGIVQEVDPEVADAYFQSRHPRSRIGAWASEQSQPVEDRVFLQARVDHFEHVFDDGEIPRPPHWSGFCIKPLMIEFWQEGPHRIHDRIVFTRQYIHQPWTVSRLSP